MELWKEPFEKAAVEVILSGEDTEDIGSLAALYPFFVP